MECSEATCPVICYTLPMGPTQFIVALRKGKPGPAYFLRGPDRFLHEESRKAVIASLPPETRQWCLAEIEFEPKRLRLELQGAYQMPMLGGHSFLIVSDREDFKHASDEDFEALDAYFSRPSSFATLVFAAVEPDRRRRFIQLLEKKAQLVEMRPPGRSEAASWLESYLQQAGVEIAPELAEEVAARFERPVEGGSKVLGVDLLWMRTEIEKLLTAKPGAKRLEPPDLKLLVSFHQEYEIGKLLRAIAERRLDQSFAVLRALEAGQQSEMLLLWYIGDLFRQSLKLSSGTVQGSRGGWQGGWNRFRSNPFSTQEIAPIVARKYSRHQMQQALRHVRQADLGIKSSWKDSRLLLEYLVWRIIAGKTAGSAPALGDNLPLGSMEA